jgi:hypothetical protein
MQFQAPDDGRGGARNIGRHINVKQQTCETVAVG